MNIILFSPDEIGTPLPKRDERTVHLVKVLHKKAGDSFDAGIIGGNIGRGLIEHIRFDGSLSYSLDVSEGPPPRSPIRIAVGFPRPIQLRRLLRDLANLGVEAIDLMGTELGEKSYRDTKLLEDGGARAALIEGAVQARDTLLPRLTPYPSLAAWLTEAPWEKEGSRRTAPQLIALDNVRPEGAMAHIPPLMRPMVLAVGSERGWSDRERDMLEGAGFLRLSLGKRALRTETACVAAVILAMEKIGELG